MPILLCRRGQHLVSLSYRQFSISHMPVACTISINCWSCRALAFCFSAREMQIFYLKIIPEKSFVLIRAYPYMWRHILNGRRTSNWSLAAFEVHILWFSLAVYRSKLFHLCIYDLSKIALGRYALNVTIPIICQVELVILFCCCICDYPVFLLRPFPEYSIVR